MLTTKISRVSVVIESNSLKAMTTFILRTDALVSVTACLNLCGIFHSTLRNTPQHSTALYSSMQVSSGVLDAAAECCRELRSVAYPHVSAPHSLCERPFNLHDDRSTGGVRDAKKWAGLGILRTTDGCFASILVTNLKRT